MHLDLLSHFSKVAYAFGDRDVLKQEKTQVLIRLFWFLDYKVIYASPTPRSVFAIARGGITAILLLPNWGS